MPAATVKSPRAIRIGATLFTIAVFLISWWHWWSFQYVTFDLAFYVQALWLALRGEWWVSLLNVPLMGNHAEPIVFLLTPFFALWPHPMLFVAVQTLALASMAFTGFRIARRLRLEQSAAIALGLTLFVLPATSSVGLHEFHPETLAAPLLLLLIEARLAERSGRFWLWFLAVLATKENMALLLVAFCGVFSLVEWRRGRAWQMRWNGWPLLAASAWLAICVGVISPQLNAGNVDYGQLYAHLGANGSEIVRNFFVAPSRAAGAIWHALTHGDIVWSLLLPLLLLPLFRAHWLLIAAPILLQHLLSSRFTEWSLGAHYAAPFIPLFWIAAAEVTARVRAPRATSFAILAAAALAHIWCGPGRELIAEIPALSQRLEEREWKSQFLARISPDASVTAAQPYLSHLATRHRLYSLHHVLKGLKTLSKERYEPTPTDVVLIDYLDLSTFSTVAGFYHPVTREGAERDIPSSDRLLHEFLRPHRWHVESYNAVALYQRGEPLPAFVPTTPPVPFDEQTTLLNLQIPQAQPRSIRLRFAWHFGPDRERFPWLMLVMSDGRQLFPLIKGACAPEAGAGDYFEDWFVTLPASMPPGIYDLFTLFYDGNTAAWQKQMPPHDMAHVWKKIEVGRHVIRPTP